MNDRELLEWSSKHYKDYIFSVFLAVCVLDCQVYEDILQMGNELQAILGKRKRKNHRMKMIGIIKLEYRKHLE